MVGPSYLFDIVRDAVELLIPAHPEHTQYPRKKGKLAAGDGGGRVGSGSCSTAGKDERYCPLDPSAIRRKLAFTDLHVDDNPWMVGAEVECMAWGVMGVLPGGLGRGPSQHLNKQLPSGCQAVAKKGV